MASGERTKEILKGLYDAVVAYDEEVSIKWSKADSDNFVKNLINDFLKYIRFFDEYHEKHFIQNLDQPGILLENGKK